MDYKEAKKLLKYDPETGKVFWKLTRNNKALCGSEAGYRDNRYLRIGVKGSNYLLHRVAWLLYYKEWPENQIDHINGNCFDNRIANIRDVTAIKNQQNAKLRKDNKSSVTGVTWHKKNNQWQANITVNKKMLYLGSFVDWFDAVCARKAADKFYGFHFNHGRRYE